MTTQRDYQILFSNYKKSRSKAIAEDQFEDGRREIIADLEQLLEKGYNTYIMGLADMYDILVAESLLEYRDTTSPQIYIYVITYKETFSYFSGSSTKSRIKRVVQGVDAVLETTGKCHYATFATPNQYLVDNLKMDVCYYHPYGDGGVLYSYKRDPLGGNIQNMEDICSYLKDDDLFD